MKVAHSSRITPFLWFNGQVAEALALYQRVFPQTTLLASTPGAKGGLSSATLNLEGLQLILFDGGPHYALSPAVSLYVNCETQAEVDELWASLTANGGRESRCGWLVDPFGLSWQIIPSRLPEMLTDADRTKANRAMQAMMGMQKLDIAALERAFAGG